jgi:hypothetical protein
VLRHDDDAEAKIKTGDVPTVKKTARISIPAIRTETIHFVIRGLSPLIVHRFSHKALMQIVDKQTGKADEGKQPREPFREFVDSLHIIRGDPDQVIALARDDEAKAMQMLRTYTLGFPAIGIKQAMTTACGLVDLAKTNARMSFHILQELVPIRGQVEMRTDVARIDRGNTATPRFRGEFKEWEMTVPISFETSAMTPERVANLLHRAGYGVGIGEWRPERDGHFGRFEVVGA